MHIEFDYTFLSYAQLLFAFHLKDMVLGIVQWNYVFTW